jgi:transposase
MAAISMDLRVRIFEARQAGESTTEVAERFEVSPAFVRRLMQRHRENGTLAPKSGPRGPKPQLADHHERIRQCLVDTPGLSANDVRERLHLPVATITVWRAIVAIGLTFKKNDSPRREKSPRHSDSSPAMA